LVHADDLLHHEVKEESQVTLEKEVVVKFKVPVPLVPLRLQMAQE
jgi:hypothetical protein